MKKVKGCLSADCSEYKKNHYKETDQYCVNCGSKLSYVCKNKKCFKQIPDDSKEAYCPVHLAEIQDEKENREKNLKKIGSGVFAIGGMIVAAAKILVNVKNKK